MKSKSCVVLNAHLWMFSPTTRWGTPGQNRAACAPEAPAAAALRDAGFANLRAAIEAVASSVAAPAALATVPAPASPAAAGDSGGEQPPPVLANAPRVLIDVLGVATERPVVRRIAGWADGAAQFQTALPVRFAEAAARRPHAHSVSLRRQPVVCGQSAAVFRYR